MRKKLGKVFVGLSGGVDSSVAAALLQEEGYDVVGVFIKVWQAEFLPCTWREERRDAMRAAAHLGIPFLTLDLEKEYKQEVVDYMIREYGAGRVPNPDVMCNKHVKFGAFLDFALKNGADFIATGHYARVATAQESSGAKTYKLFEGVDKEKDQSYFLWTLTQKELAHTLFPVGHLKKANVRALGKKFGLPNADKKDSQGLCFMGPVDMAEFLRHYLKLTKGDVLDERGQVIGVHEGALLYAIGQRHGFLVTRKSATERPYFVAAKDLQKNTITVLHKEASVKVAGKRELRLENLNIISGGSLSGKEEGCLVRIRYHGEAHSAHCSRGADDAQLTVSLDTPVDGISVGQSAVLYRGEECLGGGVIVV